MVAIIFPFVISASLLDPLYALSKRDYGRHLALEDAWGCLQAKRDEQGRYLLDHSRQVICNTGTNDQPNKWVTQYTFLTLSIFS